MRKYNIYTEKVKLQNDKFWAACGSDELYPICQAPQGDFLLKRMKRYQTCRYARNHYALSKEITYGNLKCGGDVYSENEKGEALYNFEYINGVYKKLLENGIKPIVELDFLPDALCGEEGHLVQEGFNYELKNHFYPKDWKKWSNLLTAFVENLLKEFGREEIRSWYFEVWNEPDNWPIDSWDTFFKLYDIFVDSVTKIDNKLRVGGPACFRQPFMYAFLNHVINGKNHVTGEKGIRIDFLSYHIYGASGGWLDEYPLIMPSVQRFSQELAWIKRMTDLYPELSKTEFLLDEWGVVSNYERSVSEYPPLEIRNSEYSALFLVKLVDSIIEHRVRYKFNITMLLYWGFANEDFFGKLFNGNRSLTTKYNICKPIQTAFELLSLLGHKFIETDSIAGGDEGIIASKSENGVQALIYYFNDFDAEQKLPPRDYSLSFLDLENGEYIEKVYTLDEEHNNTYRLWTKMGSPKNPTESELLQLREAQDVSPDETKELTIVNGSYEFITTLSSVSVKLITLEKNKR